MKKKTRQIPSPLSDREIIRLYSDELSPDQREELLARIKTAPQGGDELLAFEMFEQIENAGLAKKSLSEDSMNECWRRIQERIDLNQENERAHMPFWRGRFDWISDIWYGLLDILPDIFSIYGPSPQQPISSPDPAWN